MQAPREPQDPAEALTLVRRYLDATYRIAQAALGDTDLGELYGRVHASVRDLMPADNLYFALWDHASDTVSFPYFVDALDPAPAPRRLGRGLTEYVLRTGQPLLLDPEVLKELEASGEVEPIGADSLNWLGVPLIGAQGVFGALVIQIYAGNRRYTPEERDLLAFVSGQVAMAIDRNRAEANHRMMAHTIDQTRDSVFGLDAGGRIVFVNEAACRELGYDRETLLGLSLPDVDPKFPPDQWPAFMASLRAQGSLFVETEHRRKDGSTLPVEISVCHLTHEGQDLAFGYARDTTERRAAEQALRLSEEKFSKAFQSSPDAININRLDGTYLEVNSAFTRMSGWTRDEALGRTTLDLGLWVNPEDRVRALEMIKQEGQFDSLEAPFRMNDGSIRMGLLSGTVITVDGEPCMLSITRDITGRRQAEDALRQTQKLESLGVLAGGIAHDFNNLLTVVLGNLNLAQMHLPETAPARPYLANMEATVLRATELTKQMLAYSGRGHFVVRPHDLNAVVRDLTHLLVVSISKKVRLQLDLEATLPAIQADVAQLQQVVMNLVTNASDAIGDREGAIHVSTSAWVLDERALRAEYRVEAPVPGRHVILEVEDTGCGMAPEVLERIFDPFFTTKATGRGLGLSAMLGILRGHGAGLNIASCVGRGSRFRLCFPAVTAPVPPKTLEDPAPGQGPAHGLVLLVDDEERILQTTGLALEALGFQVVAAQDGLEALERFQEHRQELRLVLMDLTMPRMDGREALHAMRELDPSVPVVLSSGFSEKDSLQAFPDGGPA
ncbi:MAG: PAS domain S-box protein, partial [Geothrix sp.]|nr:PAS domain S-box protein [Geothrix sp.]